MHSAPSPGTGPFAAAVAVLLFGALLDGGGPWGRIDVLLSVMSLLVLGWAYVRQATGQCEPWAKTQWLLIAGVAALAGAQAVPLPLTLLDAIPGWSGIAADLGVAGLMPAPRRPTLDADALVRCIGAGLPALALLIGVRTFNEKWLSWMWCGVAGFAAASVILGIAQVSDGPESALRFHAFHNRVGALGLFSYRNAHASFLVMVLPMMAALILHRRAGHGQARWQVQSMLLVLLFPLMLLGVALTYSRAGAVLAIAALAGCLLLAWRGEAPGHDSQRRLWLPLAACAITLALVGAFAWEGLLERYGESVVEDGRWGLYASIAELQRSFSPLGAGWGAFEQAFQASPQNVALPGAYFNHAHNDWLQLWLELGWVFPVLAVALLFVLARSAFLAWRAQQPPRLSVHLARASSLSLALVAVHSYFDYPLHSGTNLALAGLLAGTLLWSGANAPKHAE